MWSKLAWVTRSPGQGATRRPLSADKQKRQGNATRGLGSPDVGSTNPMTVVFFFSSSHPRTPEPTRRLPLTLLDLRIFSFALTGISRFTEEGKFEREDLSPTTSPNLYSIISRTWRYLISKGAIASCLILINPRASVLGPAARVRESFCLQRCNYLLQNNFLHGIFSYDSSLPYLHFASPLVHIFLYARVFFSLR